MKIDSKIIAPVGHGTRINIHISKEQVADTYNQVEVTGHQPVLEDTAVRYVDTLTLVGNDYVMV